jgi:phage shock protein E
MKYILFIAGGLLLLYTAYRTYRFVMLDKDLDRVLTKGVLILDVRTPGEFATGHIEGAVNIPLSRLHADSIPLDKKAVIVTCCSHGLRSVKAVSLLKERGFSRVHNGGAWTDLAEKVK